MAVCIQDDSVLCTAGADERREKTFQDKEVCRPFLLGICINELFVNTVSCLEGGEGGREGGRVLMLPISPLQRAELPDCTKLHSLTLKQKYEDASRHRDYHYEEEVLGFLKAFLRDNERKIELAKTRLHHTQDAPDNEEKVKKTI